MASCPFYRCWAFSLVGGAAGVTKAINDSKAAQRQLEELQRHNCVMESRSVYLAPYKRGQGIALRKNDDETLKMPREVTTNVQLQQLTNRVRIPYFKGIFMHTTLPEGVRRNKSNKS